MKRCRGEEVQSEVLTKRYGRSAEEVLKKGGSAEEVLKKGGRGAEVQRSRK